MVLYGLLLLRKSSFGLLTLYCVSATLDVTDNVKRWVVVGISLNTVLIPPVREYLVPCMEGHYEKLKTDHGIDTQSHPGQLKKDGTFELNYRSINNNDTVKGVANYNYKVASHVDLGKLYMKPDMATFTGFVCIVTTLNIE